MVYLVMDRKTKITGLSTLVLAQVVLFVLVYLATIALGAGLVYLAFHACIWILPPFFENVAPEILRLGKLGILLLGGIIIGIIGLWAFIVALGVYLVKPLFIFPKRDKDYGIEIKREDSPKLFDLISETAKAAGVRMPKHIYVNHEVNACVFFNTGFWNIFFPVRKNLAIGLGLFEATNAEEVKSIIAHEFGHFAQSSMRVGSVLYIANKVITDLVYRRDKLDNFMLRWCLQDGIWGCWGQATQAIVIRFRGVVEAMFRSQQRNYMKLSRQMEYDADAVACRIVGSEIFVSALCKIQKLSKSFDFYNRVLGSFVSDGQIISDYWKGYGLTAPKMTLSEGNPITFDKLESIPDSEESRSRVNIEEIWESHPSTVKRIDHAKSLNIKSSTAIGIYPAWDLIEDALRDEVSRGLLKKVKLNNVGIKEIEWAEFLETLTKKINASIFPKEVEVFFNRELTFKESDLIEAPLSAENASRISEYEQALQDGQVLKLLNDGKIPVKRFRYNGIEYSIKHMPLKEHRHYTVDLRRIAERIDWTIRQEAILKSSINGLIEAAYDAINYAQSVTLRLKEDFLPVREEMIKDLNEAKIADEGDYEVLRKWLDSYETALKDTLKSLQYRKIVPFISREDHQHMIGFLDASRSFITGIDSNAIDHMFAVTDWIMRVHDNLSHAAKMVIINTLLKTELPDTDFLKLWMEESQTDNDHAGENDNDSEKDDGRERFSINSVHGTLQFVVPTDEEIDTVYYEELFRYRLREKFDELEGKGKFDYAMVATIPIKNEDGRISCVNKDDEEKFNVELQQYHRFLETHVQEPDWSAISDAAEKGDPHANIRMAELYMTQQRMNLAFDSAMIGASIGDPEAFAILGILEDAGQKHSELAVKLFKCAAAGGDAHGLCNLAMAYAKGTGIERNEERALKLFERSALQGNSIAQYNVGHMYLYGKGGEADTDRGLYWLYKSANQGSESAVNTIWQYYKSVNDMDNYVDVVSKGARQGIEECVRELEIIRGSNNRNSNPILNYDVTFNNPSPMYDTDGGIDTCPVCGKRLAPGTTVCPHCKEVIWEE